LRHRRLHRLGRRLSGAALEVRDALGRHPGPHRRQDSGHGRHPGRADLRFGTADHHSVRPDPVPRVRRFGPARDHGRAHQPARHPGRQMEDDPADGGAGLPAVRPQLGRLGPALRLPARLPAVLGHPDLAGRADHPVDRLAIFQRRPEADAGSLIPPGGQAEMKKALGYPSAFSRTTKARSRVRGRPKRGSSSGKGRVIHAVDVAQGHGHGLGGDDDAAVDVAVIAVGVALGQDGGVEVGADDLALRIDRRRARRAADGVGRDGHVHHRIGVDAVLGGQQLGRDVEGLGARRAVPQAREGGEGPDALAGNVRTFDPTIGQTQSAGGVGVDGVAIGGEAGGGQLRRARRGRRRRWPGRTGSGDRSRPGRRAGRLPTGRGGRRGQPAWCLRSGAPTGPRGFPCPAGCGRRGCRRSAIRGSWTATIPDGSAPAPDRSGARRTGRTGRPADGCRRTRQNADRTAWRAPAPRARWPAPTGTGANRPRPR
uniref:Integral membrane protein n=1 Tax=Parastrongyloides trichosuri TaxID=131310 RepID=A0A0N4ZZC0_PARTI